MSNSSPLKIQQGLFNKLTASVSLMTKVSNRIYDDVPESDTYPYIYIGQHTADRFNTFDRQGKNVVFNINIFSQYQGNKEALEILDLVIDALDYQTLTITNQTLVYCRFEQHSMLAYPDGRTKQCIANFRVVAQEN